MPTSGQVDFQLNSRDIITQALRLIRVCPAGEDPTADDAADGLVALNLMLKTWGTNRHLWLTTWGSFPLVADQRDYLVPAARRVNDVQRRLLVNMIDTPMIEMARLQYDEQPNKFTPSIPVQYYFNPLDDTRTIYLWPPPSAETAPQYEIHYTYQRVIENADTLDNTEDLPQEWLQTLVYNLADLLMDYHDVDYPKITARAAMLLNALSAQDEEQVSVFLQPQYRY